MNFQRTCLKCSLKLKKNELNRFVCTSGEIVFDKNQLLSGRGYYICNNCLKLLDTVWLENRIKGIAKRSRKKEL